MDEALSNITLAILAGGEGSRMGRPKGQLEISGVPILQWILDDLHWPGPTMLVTAPGRERPPGWGGFDREVSDPVPGMGPVRGVITALDFAATDRTIVLPVDMPFFGSRALCWLAKQQSPGGVLLKRNVAGKDRIEPMPLLVRRSALSTLQAMLADGRNAVRDLGSADGFCLVQAPTEWDAAVWSNLNSPEDLRAIGGGKKISLR